SPVFSSRILAEISWATTEKGEIRSSRRIKKGKVFMKTNFLYDALPRNLLQLLRIFSEDPGITPLPEPPQIAGCPLQQKEPGFRLPEPVSGNPAVPRIVGPAPVQNPLGFSGTARSAEA